eukprot:gene15479-17059_t
MDNRDKAVCAIIIACTLKIKDRRKRQRRRSVWCKEWLKNRETSSLYNSLVHELRLANRGDYRGFMRMNTDAFEELLEKVRPFIKGQSTNMRQPISAEEKIAVILRFLATGESYQSLKFQFRTHDSTISLFIPKCQRMHFGIMTAIFRIFGTKINLHLDKAVRIVKAALVLHNILRCRSPESYTPTGFANEIFEEKIIDGTAGLSDHALIGLARKIHNVKHQPYVRLSPWTTKDVKSEMNLRDNLLRKARRTNHEIDWSSYKRQRNRVTNLVKKCKNRYHKVLLKESGNTPDEFWAAIKKVYPTRSSVSNAGTVFEIDGIKTTNKQAIAESFCKLFANIAKTLKCKYILLRDFAWMRPTWDNTVPHKDRFVVKEVSEAAVHKELANLKRMKAAGIDNLPPGMLIDAAPILAKPLTYLINLSLKTGIVPTDWKVAKVIPLHKSGFHSTIDNYRPISVLPTLSKILEKMFHKQLMAHFENSSLLYNYQFGFRVAIH